MADAATPRPWPVLNRIQRRLLGVLVEKAKTTPDAYPLSLNALTAGANQKSNRDPILNLSEDEVEASLVSMQPLGLTTRITGGRVERWRHNLYEFWHVDKVELAILAELLVRGPQTEGELRTRASRMEPIADLDTLRAKLKPLQERGLIHWIGEEGRRGAQIAHGFHDPIEMDALRQRVAAGESAMPSAPPAASSSPALETELRSTREELAALRDQVERLQTFADELRRDFAALKQSLGG